MALRRYGYYLVGSLRYGMVVPTIQSFEAMTGRMTVDHCGMVWYGMVWYHTIPYRTWEKNYYCLQYYHN